MYRGTLLCRHCERRPATSLLGLCQVCQETRGIRRLYRSRRQDYSRLWERHLEVLARRARRQLPLGGLSLASTL